MNNILVTFQNSIGKAEDLTTPKSYTSPFSTELTMVFSLCVCIYIYMICIYM